MKQYLSILTTLFLLSISVVYADNHNIEVYNKGVEAYHSKNYKTAFNQMKLIIDEYEKYKAYLDTTSLKDMSYKTRVTPNAYYLLGYLSENGLGTLKNYKRAADYYQESITWNHPKAQLALALMMIKILEDNLIEGITKDKKLKGYSKVAELISKLYDNTNATEDMRDVAKDVWNKYELYRHID